MIEGKDYNLMAAYLESTGRYRVLRKLEPPPVSESRDRVGIFLDLETTGFDPSKDEIIEIAMVPLYYSAEGKLHGIGIPFNKLRQPSSPVSPEITRITGITNQMLEGQSISTGDIESFIQNAVLVVSHNAAFDRPFCERFCPRFAEQAWGCSMQDIDWKGDGLDSLNLSYLTMSHGFFTDHHRAISDCYAALALLSRNSKSGASGLKRLLDSARRNTWRVWAQGSPFDLKDALKARGYRWNDGTHGLKSWYIDVVDKEAEVQWLCSEVYHREVPIPYSRVTARERYSDRTLAISRP